MFRELQECPGCGGIRLVTGLIGVMTFRPFKRKKTPFLSLSPKEPRVISAACRDCGLISMYCKLTELEDCLEPDSEGEL